MFDTVPTPEDIAAGPELSVLAVLYFALEATTHALVASYPELVGPEGAAPGDPQARSAMGVIALSGKLAELLSHHRALVLAPGTFDLAGEDEDIP